MQTRHPSRRSPAARSRHSRDIRALTAALLLLLLVVVWGLVGLLIHLQEADAERASARRAQALAGSLGYHVGLRTDALERLGELILVAMEATDTPATDLAALIGELDLPPEVRQVVLLGPDGRQIASADAGLGPGATLEDLSVESAGRPQSPHSRRVLIRADASRLLSLATGPGLRLEGVALLVRGDASVLGAFPPRYAFTAENAQAMAPARVSADRDGVNRHWGASALTDLGLELQVGVASDESDRELHDRAITLVAAAAIESGVAIALAVFVLGQARHRDRMLMRLEVGRRRLRQANLAKMRFLQSISHELRTPLNGILCTAELMVQLAMNDEQADVVEVISQSASDLANMIDMLIDVAELQSGNAVIADAPADVREVIDIAGRNCLSAIWSRGGTLTQRCAPELPALLCLDQARLERIVRTLLDTACNVYDKPAVTLYAGMAGSPALLHVRVSVHSRTVDDTLTPPAHTLASSPAEEAAAEESLKATLGVLLLQDLVAALGGRLAASTPRPGEHVVEVLLPAKTAGLLQGPALMEGER